jgi:hypothetical protein
VRRGETIERRGLDATIGTTTGLTGETTTEKTALPGNTRRSVRKIEKEELLFSGTRLLISLPEKTDSTSTPRYLTHNPGDLSAEGRHSPKMRDWRRDWSY